MGNLNEKAGKGRKSRKSAFNPLQDLTPEEQNFFRLDAANNFSLSARKLAALINYSESWITKIRCSSHYKWHVHRFQQSAIEILEEAQIEAARAMKRLLSSRDERIVLLAATTILEPTHEGLKRSAILRAAAEASGQAQADQPQQIVYETEWGSTQEPKTPGMDSPGDDDSDAHA